MNHIDVMGNLVKDVEVRFTSNQKAIALFTIAENRYNFKTKEKRTAVLHGHGLRQEGGSHCRPFQQRR